MDCRRIYRIITENLDNFDETIGPELVGRLNKNGLTVKEVLQKRRQTQMKRRLTMWNKLGAPNLFKKWSFQTFQETVGAVFAARHGRPRPGSSRKCFLDSRYLKFSTFSDSKIQKRTNRTNHTAPCSIGHFIFTQVNFVRLVQISWPWNFSKILIKIYLNIFTC